MADEDLESKTDDELVQIRMVFDERGQAAGRILQQRRGQGSPKPALTLQDASSDGLPRRSFAVSAMLVVGVIFSQIHRILLRIKFSKGDESMKTWQKVLIWIGVSIVVAGLLALAGKMIYDKGQHDVTSVLETEVTTTRRIEWPTFRDPDMAISVSKDEVVHLDGLDCSDKLEVGKLSQCYQLPPECFPLVLDEKRCDFFYQDGTQLLGRTSSDHDVRRRRGELVIFRIPDDGESGMMFAAVSTR